MFNSDVSSFSILSPAIIFIEIWEQVNTLTSHQRMTCTPPSEEWVDSLRKSLRQELGLTAYHEIRLLLLKTKFLTLPSERNGMFLSIMREIDTIFSYIHPRIQYFNSSATVRANLPKWLREIRSHRSVFGAYLEKGVLKLIPRGPLNRLPRDQFASNADSMADRFSALSVVNYTFYRDTTPIKVKNVIIGNGVIGGVGLSLSAGSETVAFIPIAEKKSELLMEEKKVSDQRFVSFGSAPGVYPNARILNALDELGPVDIASAPELLVSAAEADTLANNLNRGNFKENRIIVAGSGASGELSVDGIPWNESRVLNGRGDELWRQRKIWPAGLTPERAHDFKLSDTSGTVMEENAEGDQLIISDVEGLGRCVILICQDLEARSITDDLIKQYQPDWVFVPILDVEVGIGRWAHQRAFGLSSISNARFLIVSSTALASVIGKTSPAICALAIGPRAQVGADEGRLSQKVVVDAESKARAGKIKWRGTGWEKSTLESR